MTAEEKLTKAVTPKVLEDYHNSMVAPFLNGAAHTGFTPVGTIISVMGKTAPQNYLSCDGTIYNIADYPELANYFEEQFESKSYFGGDGTTTFAVPDLRGEFIRGTGTNSHANQGSGANVGVHQDGTEIPWLYTESTGQKLYARYDGDITGANNITAYDSTISATSPKYNAYDKDSDGTPSGTNVKATTRPTNTAVLFCIATKNIYVDARFDYSAEEKIIGTWMGEPLYQKTIDFGALPNAAAKYVDHGINNLDIITSFSGFTNNGTRSLNIPHVSGKNTTEFIQIYQDQTNNSKIGIMTGSDRTSFTKTYITLQYTKTS